MQLSVWGIDKNLCSDKEPQPYQSCTRKVSDNLSELPWKYLKTIMCYTYGQKYFSVFFVAWGLTSSLAKKALLILRVAVNPWSTEPRTDTWWWWVHIMQSKQHNEYSGNITYLKCIFGLWLCLSLYTTMLCSYMILPNK